MLNKTFELKNIANYLKDNFSNTIEYSIGNKVIKKYYNEVYLDAIKALNNLCKLDIFADDIVVLYGDSSYYWLITEVACIIGGIRTVALPETLSISQAMSELRKFKAKALILDLKNEPSCTEENYCVITFDSLFENEIQESSIPDIYIDKAKYQITVYTSGTTSNIKSFEILPEATEKLVLHLIQIFKINSKDRWLICHPFTHYSHLEYALGGLCSGYDLIILNLTQSLISFSNLKPSIFISVPTSYYFFYERFIEEIQSSNALTQIIIKLYIKLGMFIKYPRINNFLGRIFCKKLHNIMGGNLKFMIIGTAPSLANIKEFFQKIGLPLFEGYGLTELGMISMNDYSKNKLFTVGTIFPGIKVDFREDNVLWVKNSYQRMNKYLNEESDLIDKDGYICTGDIGEIDKAGFLKIVGRKKEIIVTSTGKKINPIPIEQMFISYSEIKHCVLIGDNKPFISAIISPKEIQFKSNLEFENRINEIVKTINNDLSSAEKVLAAIISKKEFSEKTGMVTRSQKIVRRKVEECHTYEIKKIYDEQ